MENRGRNLFSMKIRVGLRKSIDFQTYVLCRHTSFWRNWKTSRHSRIFRSRWTNIFVSTVEKNELHTKYELKTEKKHSLPTFVSTKLLTIAKIFLRTVLFSSLYFMLNDTHMYHCKYDILHWTLCDVCKCIFRWNNVSRFLLLIGFDMDISNFAQKLKKQTGKLKNLIRNAIFSDS